MGGCMLEKVTAQQSIASNPQNHVWVAASAGTGKTKILTDRLLRLLLEGIEPDRILAVTFTKAAAFEMEHRLMARLKKWRNLSHAQLKEELKLLDTPNNPSYILKAQQLFQAITHHPKGLKIQTVHSLCQNLLSQFPLEAGLSLSFSTLDESEQTQILKATIDRILLDADYMTLWEKYEPTYIAELLIDLIQSPQGQKNLNIFDMDAYQAYLDQTFNTQKTLPLVSFEILFEELPNLQEDLTDGQKFNILEDFLFTKEGTVRQKILKRIELETIVLWAQIYQEKQNATQIKTFSILFLKAALKVHQNYASFKEHHGLLDFNDLIHQTLILLSQDDIAPWILYKLDQRIDHILVDEAQDTSPTQWAVLLKLIEDFFQNPQEDRQRSVFVVGDIKQSIYSFQGADPEIFKAIQNHLSQEAQQNEEGFKHVNLEVSFRSSQAILDVVDHVLAPHDASLFTHNVTHTSAYPERNGYVSLLPLSENLPSYLAQTIQNWLQGKRILQTTGEVIKPQDIMILCQKRGDLYYELVQSLNALGIPVDGPDRYFLKEQLSIQDLCMLARFALLPRDNFALACVLKGPLFNWDDHQLLNLKTSSTNPYWIDCPDFSKSPQGYKLLKIIKLASLSAHTFFDQLYHQEHLPVLFTKVFGPYVNDDLEAFFNLARSKPTASLQEFLDWFLKTDPEIKRPIQNPKGIRLMTAHGSKGLQAPIVILADAHLKPNFRDKFIWAMDTYPLWIPPAKETHTAILDLKNQSKDADLAEHKRLLYVAMTRSEEELYIAGSKDSKTIDPESWYAILDHGFKTLTPPVQLNGDDSQCFGILSINQHTILPVKQPDDNRELPLWFQKLDRIKEPNLQALPDPIIENGTPQSKAILEGLFMHLLLEKNPRTPQAFEKLMACMPELSKNDKNLICEDYQKLITLEHLQDIFQEPYMVELPIAGTIGEKTYFCRIDRLLVRDNRVIIIDYKTDGEPPLSSDFVSESYINQLGLYKYLLRPLFPNAIILAQILWTKTGNLMTIPDHLFERTAYAA